MLIVDHSGPVGRVKILTELLGTWRPCWSYQLYGEETRGQTPIEVTRGIRDKIAEVISEHNLILLHSGDHQHLVAPFLQDLVFADKCCIVYSGGAFPLKIAKVLADASTKKHASLPFVLERNEDPSWLESVNAVRLKECVSRIVQGSDPKDAVAAVFADDELEYILNHLFNELGQASGQPADAIVMKCKRDALLDAYYKRKRGW